MRSRLGLFAGVGAGLLALACWGPPPLFKTSGPRDFERVEIRGAAGELIWAVTADSPRPLEELVYGRSPAGFRQSFPPNDEPPRELAVGEDVVIESTTRLRVFRHEAWATGPDTVSILNSEMRLRDRAPEKGEGP